MLSKKCIAAVYVLALISACSEESTAPVQYGNIRGNVAIKSLEKSPENVPGNTISIVDLDSIKIFLNDAGEPYYTTEGKFFLARVKYGSCFLTSEILPNIKIISDQIIVDSENTVLSDTLAFPYKDDLYADLVEVRFTIPNPFTVTNTTGFYVKKQMVIDVYVIEPALPPLTNPPLEFDFALFCGRQHTPRESGLRASCAA